MENSTTITTTKGYTLKVLREGLYYQCTHLNGIELTPDYQDVLVLKTDGSFLCGAAVGVFSEPWEKNGDVS